MASLEIIQLSPKVDTISEPLTTSQDRHELDLYAPPCHRIPIDSKTDFLALPSLPSIDSPPCLFISFSLIPQIAPLDQCQEDSLEENPIGSDVIMC